MSVPFNLYCSQLSKGRKILIISISGNQSNTLQVHQASATGHRASSVIKQSVAPYATQNDSPVRMLTNKSALARAAVTRSGMPAAASALLPQWWSTGRDLSACVLSHLAKLTTACMNLCSDSLNFGQPRMVQSFLNWVKAISMFFPGLLCRSRWASRNFAPATALVSNRSCSFFSQKPIFGRRSEMSFLSFLEICRKARNGLSCEVPFHRGYSREQIDGHAEVYTCFQKLSASQSRRQLLAHPYCSAQERWATRTS